MPSTEDNCEENNSKENNNKQNNKIDTGGFVMKGILETSDIKWFLYPAIFVLLSFCLKAGASIIMPLVISLFLYILLEPLINVLKKTKIPLIILDVLIIWFVMGLFFGFSLLLYSAVNTISKNWQNYTPRFYNLVQGVSDIANKYNLDINADDIYKKIYEGLSNILLKSALTVTNSFSKFIGKFLMVLIFLFFFILDSKYTFTRFKRSFSRTTMIFVLRILKSIKKSMVKYVWIKFIMSFATALVIYPGLKFIAPINFPFTWALLVFLFNWIPSIGSLLITAVIIMFGIFEYFPNYGMIALVCVVAMVPQILIGSILDPKITGDNVNLSPIVVMISLLYFGMLWGVMGMFLSVPLAVALRSCLENTNNFKGLSRLMGK